MNRFPRLDRAAQNYLVAPDQPWLDGFCVAKGLIRQFVAMPLGKGYTAEAQLTGAAPPHVPPTAAEYTAAGLPWFDYYDADRKALEGAPRLARLDSVAVRKVKEGEPAPDEGASVRLRPGRSSGWMQSSNAVREGAF